MDVFLLDDKGGKHFINPDSNAYGDDMGPTWVLLAPDASHIGPMNLAIREVNLIRSFKHTRVMVR